MLIDQVLNPDAGQLKVFLDEQLGSGCVIQLVGTAEVAYQGRARSTADAGDIMLIIKADSSISVHTCNSVKPMNWQPHTDHVYATREDGRVSVVAERYSPHEVIIVTLHDTTAAQAFNMQQTSKLLSGSEAELKARFMAQPHLIEAGLELLHEELPIDVGKIDLYGRDARGNLVVIELKRGKALQEAVHQLSRYVQLVEQEVGHTIRGLLVAPGITQPALRMLLEQGHEFVEVTVVPPLAPAVAMQEPLF